MVRKISFLIISATILVFGVSAFSKLGYWERSAAILTLNPQTPFSGRAGDHHERTGESNAREEGDRSGDRIDRFELDEDLPEDRQVIKSIPDSLDKAGSTERNKPEKRSLRDGIRNGEGHRGGDSREGNKINLGKVFLFLAVFASFTVIAIYAETSINLMRKRKTGQEYPCGPQIKEL
jgi:hypothetical protein